MLRVDVTLIDPFSVSTRDAALSLRGLLHSDRQGYDWNASVEPKDTKHTPTISQCTWMSKCEPS